MEMKIHHLSEQKIYGFKTPCPFEIEFPLETRLVFVISTFLDKS